MTYVRATTRSTPDSTSGSGSSTATSPTSSSERSHSAVTSRGIPWPTCCSGTTPVQACSSLRRLPCPGSPAILANSTSILRALHPGRLEGVLQPDLEPRPALGLPDDAVQDEQPHGMAGHDQCARRHVHRRPVARGRGHRRRRQLLSVLWPEEPEGSVEGDFAPRLGFAWRPFNDGRTVVRGGYGIFYDSAEGREIDGSADIYPYVSRGNYPQSIGQLTPLQTTDSLFPVFSNPGPVTPAANSFIAVIISENPKDPYVQQWSLGAQRSITSNTTFELNYVGSKGTNLLMRRNIAQALPYTPITRACEERKPFPNFGVYINSDWSGYSNYNALNAKLEHRARGALVTLAYTWAKSTDSKSAAAGIGAIRVQRLAGIPEQPRPAARSRAVGLRRGPPPGRQLRLQPAIRTRREVRDRCDGRQERRRRRLAGERHLHLATRLPDHGHGAGSRRRARYVRDEPRRPGRRSEPVRIQSEHRQWFNTAAFAQPALGSSATVGRNTMRAPNTNNLDFALFKNFELPRSMKIQFRLESFNAFNHPQFNAPRHERAFRRGSA